MFTVQYLECTVLSYDKLRFKYSLPEHNLEDFRPNYKQMKLQLSALQLSTSTPTNLPTPCPPPPYLGDNEGLGAMHKERKFEKKNGLKNQNYGPPRKELDCPPLKIPGEWKLLTLSHHKSLSQHIDTWQPTDR